MRRRAWAIPLSAALLMLPAASAAQEQHCAKCASHPCCANSGEHDHGATPQAEKAPAGVPGYDMSLEQRLTGILVSAIALPGSTELVVTVSNGENSFNVEVGPADWMAQRGYTFVPGEGVEILGSMLWSEGSDTIVARQIWKGGSEMTLRDKAGRALWVSPQNPS